MQNLEINFMQLDQFDKLERNIKNSVKYIFDLKTENNRLKKEVEKLKEQIETTSERGKTKPNNHSENNEREMFPKAKTERLVSQLDEVIKKMKNFTTGVEF